MVTVQIPCTYAGLVNFIKNLYRLSIKFVIYFVPAIEEWRPATSKVTMKDVLQNPREKIFFAPFVSVFSVIREPARTENIHFAFPVYLNTFAILPPVLNVERTSRQKPSKPRDSSRMFCQSSESDVNSLRGAALGMFYSETYKIIRRDVVLRLPCVRMRNAE